MSGLGAVGAGSFYAVSVVIGDPVTKFSASVTSSGITTALVKGDRSKAFGLPGIPPEPTAVIATLGYG